MLTAGHILCYNGIEDSMDLTRAGTVTLTNIANGTGLSLSMVSRIMAGKRTPSLDSASKIAAYLGISIEELMQSLPVEDQATSEDTEVALAVA